MANKSTLTANERLALVNVKVERAKKHIADLNGEIRSFFETDPYVVGTKRNPDTRQLIYYVARTSPIPDCFSTITGDAIHNLRSALDHLMHQLWDVANPSTPAHRDLMFPTDSGANQFKTGSPPKVKGLRQDAIDTINRIEPYDRGKGADLSVLNRLDRVDKHRLLITVGSALRSFNIGAFITDEVRRTFPDVHQPEITFHTSASVIFPLKEGDELFVDSPDAEVKHNYDFTFDITLHEPGVVERKPLLVTVQHLADFVGATISSFKHCLN